MALAPEVEEIVERNAEAMRNDWEDLLGRLLVDWEPITQLQSQSLQGQIRKIVDDDDISGLEDLDVPTEDAQRLLSEYLLSMYILGEDQIVKEALAQGVDLEVSDFWQRGAIRNALDVTTIDTLVSIAGVIVTGLASGLKSAVSKLVLRLWGTQSNGDSMATEVREFINGLSDRALRDELGGGLTNAMNRGRFAALLRSNAATWYATERNDSNACSPCKAIDETQFATLAAAMAAYPTGGYKDCEGGVRCRGGVVPVWEVS